MTRATPRGYWTVRSAACPTSLPMAPGDLFRMAPPASVLNPKRPPAARRCCLASRRVQSLEYSLGSISEYRGTSG
jgi:hypothetical protein